MPASASLVQMLEKGHHDVKLDAEAWDRLITWIDLNVPDHGTWSEHRADRQRTSTTGGWRCGRSMPIGRRTPRSIPRRRRSIPTFVQPEPAEPIDNLEFQRRRLAVRRGRGETPPGGREGSALGSKPEMTLPLGGGVQLDLVLIPAGEFVMGDADGWRDEQPLSKVKIAKAVLAGQVRGDQRPVRAVRSVARQRVHQLLQQGPQRPRHAGQRRRRSR